MSCLGWVRSRHVTLQPLQLLIFIAWSVELSSAFQNIPSFPLLPSSISTSTRLNAYNSQPTAAGGVGGGVNKINKVDIDEDTPRDITTFEQWASACGVQRVDGFQLTMDNNISQDDDDDENEDEHPGRFDCSVVTTQNLPANQPVLMVPSVMILTGMRAREEFGIVEDADKMLMDGLDSTDHICQFYLFLKILKEYELGHNSAWYPWLNSLPRYFSNGSSMTRYCTDCLPPLVGRLTLQEQMRYRQFYRAIRDSQYINFLEDRTKYNRDLMKWAFAVVYTRSFPTPDGSGDVQIVPMADYFNHGSQAEIMLQSDEEGNCYAVATYDVPAGSPLRMCYGDPTNPSFLFARYGIVDESSPATFCKIMIPRPTQQLVDMGYDHSKMLFYKETGDVSEEVWDILLYQLLGVEHAWDQQAFYDAHVNGDYGTKQGLHQQYFPKTLKALKDHVDSSLKDLDKLTKKIEGSNQRIYPRLPLLLKHNEFVKNTFLKVKSRLQEYD